MPSPSVPDIASSAVKQPAALGNALEIARPLRPVFFAQGQMIQLGHLVRFERNQNPANPSGLLYGIATLVTSSSEPSGFVAYPTSFDAFP